MVTVGLLVTMQAKPGKEDELAGFLAACLPLAQAVYGAEASGEPRTLLGVLLGSGMVQ